MAKVLQRYSEGDSEAQVIRNVFTELPSMSEFMRTKFTLLRSSAIGAAVGAAPGVGATTAAFISYSEAVRWSKTPRVFGTGEPEGIIAPESANNAAVGGSMIPLMALGILGSATTSAMLGRLTIYGIIPGPLMMIENRDLVYSLFIGTFFSNILMPVFGLRAARYLPAFSTFLTRLLVRQSWRCA